MDADRPEEIDFVLVSCFPVTSFISFFFFWNNISLSLLIINYTKMFLDFLLTKKKKREIFLDFSLEMKMHERNFYNFSESEPWLIRCGTNATRELSSNPYNYCGFQYFDNVNTLFSSMPFLLTLRHPLHIQAL